MTATSPMADVAPATGLITSAPVGENLPVIQNSPAESAPFIEPAKPKEVAVNPETNESATNII